MKKVAAVTATRAEYGLLLPVISELRRHESNELKIELIVTGTHLSENYGMTINEIDVRIDHKIIIPVKSDTESDISSNQVEVLIRFTELFIEEHYNAIILLEIGTRHWLWQSQPEILEPRFSIYVAETPQRVLWTSGYGIQSLR